MIESFVHFSKGFILHYDTNAPCKNACKSLHLSYIITINEWNNLLKQEQFLRDYFQI